MPQRRASFDMPTTKNAPKIATFAHFDFETRFRPQPCFFFDIRTSKRAPRMVRFFTFWLGNALRTTTAYIFWTSQLPKMVRTWCLLYVSCTFSFLISPHGAPAALASLLFDPPDQQIIGKTMLRDFPNISRICT